MKKKKNKNPCVVSFFSKGREDYTIMARPMIEAVYNANVHYNLNFDAIFYSPDSADDQYCGYPIRKGYPQPKAFECKTHAEIPYQFKLGAIQVAREEGYEKILWTDTTIKIVAGKDLTNLLQETIHGIVAFDNLGHPLYKYISDVAASQLGVTDEQLMTIPHIWGGAFMIDFTNPYAVEIFNDMVKYSQIEGVFQNGGSRRPEFVAHRHDQAAYSVIMWKHGVRLQPYGKILLREHNKPPYRYGNDAYLIYN